MKPSYLLLLPLLATLLVACGGDAGEPTTRPEIEAKIAELRAQIRTYEEQLATLPDTSRKEKTTLVELQEVKPTDFVHRVELQGRVESQQNIIVSSPVAGRIVKLPVRDGQFVKAGQLIAQLDDAVVRRQIEEAKINIEQLRILYERQKNLWDQEIGTEIQFITAKNNYEGAKQSLNVLEEQLALYKITAPISGQLDDVLPKQGEMAGAGTPIAEMVSTGDYVVKVAVAENYAADIQVGDQVDVRFPDLDAEVRGRVSVVGATIDPERRTFNVEVRPLAAVQGLRPNLFAYVVITDYTATDAIVVPVSILKREDKSRYLYVAEQDGSQLRAKKLFVKVGRIQGQNAEILTGLKPGMRIVTTGSRDVSDQAALALTNDAPAPAPTRTKPTTEPAAEPTPVGASSGE